MQKAEWIEPDRILAMEEGTHGMEPGMVVQFGITRYWVVDVLDPITLEVVPEIDLKVSAETPDKFPIWRFLLLLFLIYFIVRVLL